jgi:hypothetical protein
MAFRRHMQADPTEAPLAFWNGRYADFLLQRGEHVPCWAWMNALAHGSTLLVASLATATPVPDQLGEDLRPWFRARKAMALAVMELVSREGVRLRELQEKVLIGLELELAATIGHYERGPMETACLVVDGLEAYCRQR